MQQLPDIVGILQHLPDTTAAYDDVFQVLSQISYKVLGSGDNIKEKEEDK